LLTGKKFPLLVSLSILALTVFAVSFQSSYALEESASDVQGLVDSIPTSNMAVPFIQNQGQISNDFDFYAKTFAGTVYVNEGGLTYSLIKSNGDEPTQGITILEKFLTIQNTQPIGLEKSKTIVNYYVGAQENWRTNVPTYNSITLGEVCPSVTLELKASANNYEKIFKVAPGGNVDNIRLGFDGINHLEIVDNGDLYVETTLGVISLSKPTAFQDINDVRQNVDVSYFIDGNSYGFVTGDYDPRYVLVIDPLIVSTFLGGSLTDQATAVAVDSVGNVFVGGTTASTDFPSAGTANGQLDAFIAKFDDTVTSLLTVTYLGGTQDDSIYDIAIDSSDILFVTGQTLSPAFPLTAGNFDSTLGGTADVFISSLDNGLVLTASTYLGGSGDDIPGGIGVDGTTVYVTGTDPVGDFFSSSPAIPMGFSQTYQGGADTFLVSIDKTLTTPANGTYFGGSGADQPNGLALSSTEVYLTGIRKRSTVPIGD